MIFSSKENYIYENIVVRPPHSPSGSTFDEWVTHNSPKWQRDAIVKMSRILCHESPNLRQDLDNTKQSWRQTKIVALPILVEAVNIKGCPFQVLIGFIRFHEYSNPVLFNCYLLPAFRSKGILIKAWGEIKKRYKKIEIEPPISKAMEMFLKKIDQSCLLESM